MLGGTGSGFANAPFAAAVTEADSYGIEANIRFGKLQIGGWAGDRQAESLDDLQ